ncbi:MAG: alanine--tRNA ligase [Candidatus Daviesbacteria bacterium]|nr:alanine--tRNA ligase [Candidatus Daviesbacteria bacterium]
MTSQELRAKFLKFFEKNDHKIIPSASLVPSEEEQLEGKEKVLFTSAGMQPLIPYLIGQKEPPSKRLANVQKCLRTDDIEKVGDAVHHTFFEMLGNWSIGDYWKEEAIRLSFEFLTQELGIPIEKLAISVFAGDEDAPKDEESAQIWKSLGISEKRIFYFGKNHNWWPTGEKSGLCGPDTEMFYWIGGGKPEGKPNEDSRWVEIWNDVFMQFNRKEDGTLEDLPQKNVDTGMGLERILAVLNGKESDYETDLFLPIIKVAEEQLLIKFKYGEDKRVDRAFKIIADHIKAVVFLINEDIEPSNKDRGYILRRLIRRTLTQNHLWGDINSSISLLVNSVIEIYKNKYSDLARNTQHIKDVIKQEEIGANKAVNAAMTVWRKWVEEEHRGGFGSQPFGTATFGSGGYLPPVSAEKMFDLYQSYGLHPEIMEEITQGQFDRTGFDKLFFEHQKRSRAGLIQKFAGGLAGHSETEIKYHTATHLLHQALRDVLGPEVFQKGSNITAERLRFDFSYPEKLTDEQIKKVEDLVNQKIAEDLEVTSEVMSKEEALKSGALGFFNEKYGDKVKVYTIGSPSTFRPRSGLASSKSPFSREICGGPHVERTGVIGKIQIIKEEAVSSGIRRIRAEIVLR